MRRRTPNTRVGRRASDDADLDRVVTQNASNACRRYQYVCESRLRESLQAMRLDKELSEHYVRGAHLTTSFPISFENAMQRIGGPPRNLERALLAHRRVCARRTDLMKHRAWLVVANPIFSDPTHPLHKKAMLACDATKTTLLVACSESTGLTRQPIMQFNQCCYCGILTKETTMFCACGHLCGCSKDCLRKGADSLRHDCYATDDILRRVCANVILSIPTFPFVQLINPLTQTLNIPIHVASAINLMHFNAFECDFDDVCIDVLVRQCSVLQKLLLGASRRASSVPGMLHRSQPLRVDALKENIESSVSNASRVVVL